MFIKNLKKTVSKIWTVIQSMKAVKGARLAGCELHGVWSDTCKVVSWTDFTVYFAFNDTEWTWEITSLHPNYIQHQNNRNKGCSVLTGKFYHNKQEIAKCSIITSVVYCI